MTYSKPEILVLGDANRVIQSNCPSKGGNPIDSCAQAGPSAYDLDE